MGNSIGPGAGLAGNRRRLAGPTRSAGERGGRMGGRSGTIPRLIGAGRGISLNAGGGTGGRGGARGTGGLGGCAAFAFCALNILCGMKVGYVSGGSGY